MTAKAKRGYGEGSIFKDKDGIWHAKEVVGRYPNGQRKFKEFTSSKKSVVVKRLTDYRQEQLLPGSHQPASNISLDVYIRYWLENVKKNEIKLASYDRAKSTVETYICPLIGYYNLTELTTNIIQTELINVMRDTPNSKTKKANSFSTIHKAYVYLNACLNYAVDNEKIHKNPCRNITLPETQKMEIKDPRFFSDTEILSFKNVCDEKVSSFSWAYKFIMYTGLREGEMCGLRKKNVDLENRQIYICETLVYINEVDKNGKKHHVYRIQPTTKNQRPRFVPLSQSAIDTIKPIYDNCSDNNFLINNKSTPYHMSFFIVEYKALCKRAGIKNPLGPHTLRHTFASKLFREGVDVKSVSELLGHASVAFTYKTYIHLIEKTKTDAVSVFDK